MQEGVMDKLLPCPCCGGAAEIVRASEVQYGNSAVKVRCTACSLSTKGHWVVDKHEWLGEDGKYHLSTPVNMLKEEAAVRTSVKDWNRRAPSGLTNAEIGKIVDEREG